jgi:cold shock CspA family protein
LEQSGAERSEQHPIGKLIRTFHRTAHHDVPSTKENAMPTGKLIKLIHLSQQTHVPSTRLVAGHNDKGYGIIKDADGHDVYFSHQAVDGLYGFDDLRKGQQVDYTLENAPSLRADSVRIAKRSADVQRPAA